MKPLFLIMSLCLALANSACLREFADGPGVDLFALFLLGDGEGSTGSGSTVTVSNVQDGDRVQTGFIVGTVSPVAGVEAAVDGGVFSALSVGSDGSWSYALPAGTSGWSQGSSHTFQVRATNGSTTVSLSIKRGVNRDLNGDGYPEFTVSALGYPSATNTGRVYLYYGDPNTQPQLRTPVQLTGQSTFNQFGTVRTGDLNGDGYAELIVGAGEYGGNAGRVYIWNGKDTQLTNDTAPNADIEIVGTGGHFGGALAAGDLNNDGYDELVVGSYDRGSGDVRIWNGSAAGITTGSGDGTYNQVFTTSATYNLGNALLIEDLSGDGIADLVMAEFNYNNDGTGRVHVFQGVSGTGITGGPVSGASTSIQGASAAGELGRSLAAGDVSGDGVADLIIGAPLTSPAQGSVYLFHGGASFFGQGSISATTAQWSTTGEGTNNRLGDNVASCDANNDGIDDLIMGARGHATDTGRVYVFSGSSGMNGTPAVTAANLIASGNSTGDLFGSALVLTDWNADGTCDPTIGAAGYNTGGAQGALFFYSAPSGTFLGQLNGENANDQLGGFGY